MKAHNQQSHGKPNTPLNFVRIKMLAQNPAPVRFTCFGRYAVIVMRTFLLLILQINVAYASCEMLVHKGGWSADGKPGLVELIFKNDKSMSFHYVTDGPAQYTLGSWSCKGSELTVEINGSLSLARVELVGNEWTLIFQNTSVVALSNRELTWFGY